MASKKKRVEENMDDLGQDDSGGNSNGDSDGDNEFVGQNVQVDFEARIPNDGDFNGIKKLIQQLFLKANINLSELTDTVISQNHIGSVIKQCEMAEENESDEDDEDVFGVTTVINLTQRQEMASVKQLCSFLVDKCEQCKVAEKHEILTRALDGTKQVGFIINERFINIPPQITPPILQSLQKEMEAECAKKKMTFDNFIMISKIYKCKPEITSKKKKKLKNVGDPQEAIYTNVEEEIFLKEGLLTFDYDVSSERDSALAGDWDDDDDPELLPWRRVILLSADKFPVVVKTITDAFSQGTS